MRAAVAEHGLDLRLGVNPDEVVVGGESETLVTGDAVDVAARLEQAAAPGELVIGSETRLLVRDVVPRGAARAVRAQGEVRVGRRRFGRRSVVPRARLGGCLIAVEAPW